MPYSQYKNSTAKKNIELWIKILFFLVTVAVIVQFYPQRSGFGYEYSEGKPWNYELMTAPYDFAVLKDSALLRKQQQEVLETYEPYVRKDEKTGHDMVLMASKIEDDKCAAYVSRQLKQIYSTGIMPSLEIDTLMKSKHARVKILTGNKVEKKVELSNLYTVRTAYAKVMNECPSPEMKSALKELNISTLLTENMRIDTVMSNKERAEMLKTVSLTSGMIQAGERIIDRGEIVTHETEQILNSLKASYEEHRRKGNAENQIAGMETGWLMTIVGEVMAATGLMVLLFFYLYLFRPKIFAKNKNIVFILITILIPVIMANLALRFSSREGFVYIVPFALVPIVIRSFFDTRTALFSHIVATFCVAIVLASPFEFTLFQITAGMTAVSCLKDLTTRSQLARAAVFVFIDYVVFYLALQMIQVTNLSKIDPVMIVYFGVSALLLLFAYGLIFVFEKSFGYVSPVSLVELSNVNTPLLLRFAEEAPGTFQHSLQVANLVQSAAPRVNANALLARVGALYHDIGKLQHPEFFTENQLSGVNPLSNLDPLKASSLIIEHVKDGVTMAMANNLPQPIIEFIKTHHANGRTKYFYNTYVNQHPDEVIPDSKFRYEGPKPYTREQAILLMADAVEAASRSIVFPSTGSNTHADVNELSNKLDKLVDDIVSKQLIDGLLSEADISFSQVETVKDVFKSKLKTIYHTRISYPELIKQQNISTEK